VIHLAGKNTEKIIDILAEKKDISEFKIADKLQLTVNQARNILYKLYAHSIVSFIRKKDRQKGWFVYYYTLNVPKSLEKLIELKKKEIENLKHQLSSRENKNFFRCESCNVELNEETALLHDFLCPECGVLLKAASNVKIISETKNAIASAEKELNIAKGILLRIREKEEKKYTKKMEKEAKEKAIKRAKERKKKMKLKQKEKAELLAKKKKKKPKKAKKRVKGKKPGKRIRPLKRLTKKKERIKKKKPLKKKRKK